MTAALPIAIKAAAAARIEEPWSIAFLPFVTVVGELGMLALVVPYPYGS
jgi:hypothetical protein